MPIKNSGSRPRASTRDKSSRTTTAAHLIQMIGPSTRAERGKVRTQPVDEGGFGTGYAREVGEDIWDKSKDMGYPSFSHKSRIQAVADCR